MPSRRRARGFPGGAGTTRAPSTRTDRGVVAVEMALLLPVLIMLIFMIIDFGRAFNAQLRLNEAARQGVRTAVLTQPPADPQTAAADIMTTALGGLAVADPGAVEPCAGTAAQARATVVYDFQGTLFNRTLIGQAVMQCPT
ncbi:TadE-like protein [Thermomonospora echinospora]|uniref:TadE-like protein n=1 Tax=Thermomonospora echinospora TaxID=1992 RepID=A0A1H5X0I8_9ACTN|nr:TadE/TadG family type IV pilus assembly protein [Thermomonospora echinospora]SEG05302.1 TadE-like protein [Thermomonospora echinospora]